MSRVRLTASLTCGALTAFAGVAAAHGAPPRAAGVTVSGKPSGRAMPRGFVGVSLEFNAVRDYTGRGAAVNPVLVALLRALAPGAQRPVLRIGGNSTDYSWLPVRGMTRPAGIRYRLGHGWLDSTQALAQKIDAQLIMGVNLEAGSPRLAAAEAHAFLHAIGRRYIEALEIGNEPDLYAIHPWYVDSHGTPVYARRPAYGFPQFMTQFTRWSHALPAFPLAGPSLASTAWFKDLRGFAGAEPRLRIMTVHRYPLSNCVHDPRAPGYPTISRLLTGRSSAALAGQVAPAVQAAHSRGLPLRLDEMNSVSCSGRLGVSNTFASALWALNALFGLARVGVDGVNVHTWPGAAYQLFSFRRAQDGGWLASVAPEYYGLLAFERAFPPGTRPLPVSVAAGGGGSGSSSGGGSSSSGGGSSSSGGGSSSRGGGAGGGGAGGGGAGGGGAGGAGAGGGAPAARALRAWATIGRGHTRVVLINDSQSAGRTVRLRLAGGSGKPGVEEWLRASSAHAVGGITLAGQSFGAWTSSGRLEGPLSQPQLLPSHGAYELRLPPASAVLLRF